MLSVHRVPCQHCGSLDPTCTCYPPPADMFHSQHAAALLHATARAISGAWAVRLSQGWDEASTVGLQQGRPLLLSPAQSSAHPYPYPCRCLVPPGGPVYVSDRPGRHDFALLRRLVLPDGAGGFGRVSQPSSQPSKQGCRVEGLSMGRPPSSGRPWRCRPYISSILRHPSPSPPSPSQQCCAAACRAALPPTACSLT